MFDLLRENYTDRPLDPAALQGAAEMWVGWYRIWSRLPDAEHFASVDHRVVFELYGVPRSELPEAEASLSECVGSVPGCVVGPGGDADTLRVTGPYAVLDEPPEISVWLSALSSPHAAGRCAFLRVEVHARDGRSDERPKSKHELVLVGTAAPPGLLLKAVWREGNDREWSRLYRRTPWPEETRLLMALDVYRSVHAGRVDATEPLPPGGAAPSPADHAARESYNHFLARGGRAFARRGSERVANSFVRLLFEVGRNRRPGWFLLRLAVACLPAATLFALAASAHGARSALLPLAGAAAVLPLWIAWNKVKRAWTYKRRMTAALSQSRQGPLRFRDADLNAEGLAEDVNGRKFTRELTDAGCTWCRDFRIGEVGAVNRLFVHEGHQADVVLGLMTATARFRFWPARVILQAATRFSDGSKLTTVNTAAAGRRPDRERGPDVVRIAVGADPATLLRLHGEALAPLLAAGRSPVEPQPGRYAEVLEAERRKRADETRGKPAYTWREALRAAFDIKPPEADAG